MNMTGSRLRQIGWLVVLAAVAALFFALSFQVHAVKSEVLLAERQILVDNIVQNGRLGYYVITPLEYARGEPLLLVNRGWVEKTAYDSGSAGLSLPAETRDIYGRIGSLPRAGLKRGDAFMDAGDDWPKIGVYPTADEVAAQLGRDVLPYILLLAADDPRGFVRDWRPSGMGPMTHYGYAFQWFAMAFAVVVIAFWQLRKRGRVR